MTKANNVLKLRPLRHEDREWLNQYLTIQCRISPPASPGLTSCTKSTLACCICISLYNLPRIFIRFVGINPSEMVHQQRLSGWLQLDLFETRSLDSVDMDIIRACAVQRQDRECVGTKPFDDRERSEKRSRSRYQIRGDVCQTFPVLRL